MTRLKSSDIASIGYDWRAWEENLKSLTGLGLAGLCASALDIKPDRAQELLRAQTVAVVPDLSGEGLIEGFGSALAKTALRLGSKALIASPAPSGFVEARELGATITLS